MIYSLVKPLLFSLPAETAHEEILHLAKLSPFLGKLTGISSLANLTTNVGNNVWSFPVGLAAGLDKNAEALPFFSHQGFGSLECGTITLRPQDGNPRPRLWRYPEERSLRNAMGFPNHGLKEILPRLRSYEGSAILGANIGKNKESTPEESIEELGLLFETLHSEVDYFVVNVSSPNTPGLRALQERSYLSELFTHLNKIRQNSQKDLYLKIAPDLEPQKIIELSQLACEFKLTGLIATNTTIMPERGAGGVSGELLKERSSRVRKLILDQDLPLELIGVGGISEGRDLFEFWSQGGKAAQVYTSYVYQGPGVLHSLQKSVLNFLEKSQIKDLRTFFAFTKKERRELLSQHSARGDS